MVHAVFSVIYFKVFANFGWVVVQEGDSPNVRYVDSEGDILFNYGPGTQYPRVWHKKKDCPFRDVHAVVSTTDSPLCLSNVTRWGSYMY